MVKPSLAESPDRPGIERPPELAAPAHPPDAPPEPLPSDEDTPGSDDPLPAGWEDARSSLGFVMV